MLFNDALNTFYLQLYGIRHMAKDHSRIEETRYRHIGVTKAVICAFLSVGWCI